MHFDRERAKQTIATTETVELLDRITAYRPGMEPEAVSLIEEELVRRGVSSEDVLAHGEQLRRSAILLSDGTAASCSFCDRPAVTKSWSWHRVWNVLPLFPRPYYYCARHRPQHAP